MRTTVNGLEIGYDLEGPSGAPVVALAHCFSANRDLWRLQVPALLEAGFRVLRHDARGHGESAAPADPFSLADMADDVAGLMDILEIDRVHFCGISMSGMVGQFFGLNHGNRLHSLVLACTCSAYRQAQVDAWVSRIDALRREGPTVLVDGLMARWFTPESLARKAHGVEMMRTGFLDMRDDVRLTIMSNLQHIDTTEQLHRITSPTLIIAGERDQGTPPERLEVIHKEIAGSELTVIKDSGHIPPDECPDAFNAALIGFLRRHADV